MALPTSSSADDSESTLYQAEGQTRTLSELCELMITVSSNLATNLVIEKLGVENIRNTVHALHADGMHVLRGVEDNKAFDKGLNNTTTAREPGSFADRNRQGQKRLILFLSPNDRDSRAPEVQREHTRRPAAGDPRRS